MQQPMDANHSQIMTLLEKMQGQIEQLQGQIQNELSLLMSIFVK